MSNDKILEIVVTVESGAPPEIDPIRAVLEPDQGGIRWILSLATSPLKQLESVTLFATEEDKERDRNPISHLPYLDLPGKISEDGRTLEIDVIPKNGPSQGRGFFYSLGIFGLTPPFDVDPQLAIEPRTNGVGRGDGDDGSRDRDKPEHRVVRGRRGKKRIFGRIGECLRRQIRSLGF